MGDPPKKCVCQLSPSCQLLQMLPHNIASFAAHLKTDVANTVNSVVQPDGHAYARNQTFNITPTPACDVHVNTSQMLLLWLKAITPSDSVVVVMYSIITVYTV